MKLSKRLQTVANLVDGKRVIDVGCDHGYLSIYLTQHKIKCLATDISSECILKALDNFKTHNVEINTIVTDGLKNIDVSNYDTTIISGMGTHTILKILSNKELTDTLIISSNNNLKILRQEVVKLGFYIDNEVYVKENNQKYVVIRFKKGNQEYNDLDYIVGPILKKNNKYIDDYVKDCQSIIDKINDKNNDKVKYYLNIIEQLKSN